MIGKLGKEVKALKKILIVEDDQLLNRTLAYNLTSDGYEVISVFNFDSAVRKLRENEFDVALLDINLPDGSGLDLCEEIRNRGQHTYIIFITANDKESDMLKGYEVGGADYVTKPFGMMELVSRIRAVLRRTSKKEEDDTYVLGEIRMDRKKHEVTVAGEPVALTLKEYELLRKLMENQNIVLTRDKLLEEIWGYDFDGDDRVVDTHIKRIRKALGEKAECIKTIINTGYSFREV